MPLAAGDKLGPYEVIAPLGQGGMGEVYRARDTQLGREVAIKVLPKAMANDPERLARFDREAKILATLNHSNIAMIYGLVDSGAGRALAMELVAGETLADRMKRGPLAVEEACKVAIQIAEALEAAHERNVVHRDLKPGNIMITPAGAVKVLDFGLAAMAGPSQAEGNPDASPTITMGMTQAGVIMGTAAYMSPEQAAGLPVDKRADIWSFGVVLWEMLTAKRLFSGATVSHTLADVLRAPIDLDAVSAPAPAKKLLRRCLDREVKTRLRDVGEARVALAEYLANPNPATANAAAPPVRAAGRGSAIAWGVAAAALVGAAFLAWRLWSAAPQPDRPLIRLSVDLGPDAVRGRRLSVLPSPDGTRIVFTGRAPGGVTQLYTRKLDQSNPVIIPGSGFLDASMFFSPDGKWIGFVDVENKIRKVAADGGAPLTLGSLPQDTVFGASWGDDDNIILGSTAGLFRLPSHGGSAQPINKGQIPGVFPQVLPGAKAAVFSSIPSAGASGVSNMENLDISAIDFNSGQTRLLVHGGYWPRYLPTSAKSGHLVYMHEGTLFGVAFDPRSLALLGTPTPLLDDVAASNNALDGGGQFSFDQNGTLVYLSGRAESGKFPIDWLDPSGKTTALSLPPGTYGAPRLSPDGKQLAYIGSSGKGFDVWVYDFGRAASTQLTFLGSVNNELAWARDSKHLVYEDGAAMWWIRADGAGQPQPLVEKMPSPRPGSFAPDGRLLFSPSPGALPDIWTLPVDVKDLEHPEPGKAEPFLADPAIVEVDPAFSPDGKFIAYASNESGQEEVFVRPFPGPGGKWKVSTQGGKFPAWVPAAHEILFLGSDDRIMAASYTTSGDVFTPGVPHVWSPTPVRRNNVQQSFDVSPDGKRVIMFPHSAAEASGGNLHATFLLNFFDEVRRRVPVAK